MAMNSALVLGAAGAPAVALPGRPRCPPAATPPRSSSRSSSSSSSSRSSGVNTTVSLVLVPVVTAAQPCRPARRRHHVCHAAPADTSAGATVTAPQQPERPAPEQQQQQQQQQQQPSVEDVAAVSPRKEAQLTLEQYKEIYDRLIAIFQQRPRDDWKKLIVFSKQWPQHQQGVFDRIKELADKETDVDNKMSLRKLFRGLQGVNVEVKRYNTILGKLTEAAQDEWEPIVTVYRGDLQRGFFEHMQCLIAAAKKEGVHEDLDRLVLMNTRLVALCTNYDSVAKDQDKLEAAAEVYRDLLSSISSLEDADKKMSDLASQGKIDPAFLQISAKAYGAARDTNMTLDEAKWVAYKLYRNARDHFDRQQSAEKRIIEYLCSIPDPQERRNQLDQAVTPGPTRNTDTHDYMWSTPHRLYIVLDTTLQAHAEMQAAAMSRLNTSEESITPRKIRVMRELRDEIMRRYL